MKVQVEDKNRVKDVKFHYPHLMSAGAKHDIIKEYYSILQLEEELNLARESVRNIEKSLKEVKEKFDAKKNLFTLEFEEKEVEHIDRTTINMAVVNPTDASNKTYGL